jgi:hypothetical protein
MQFVWNVISLQYFDTFNIYRGNTFWHRKLNGFNSVLVDYCEDLARELELYSVHFGSISVHYFFRQQFTQ